MARPFVQLKFACSLDGYLDDSLPNRRVFSSPEDLAEVDSLRSEMDGILIGAETLRRDRPKLGLKSGKSPEPARIVVTSSGDLPADAPLFTEGTGKRIIYAPESAAAKLNSLSLPATIRILGAKRVKLPELLEDLQSSGVRSLLVEGGAQVLTEFIESALFDRLRVAVAPQILAEKAAPRIAANGRMNLRRARSLGQTTVLEYEK